MKRTRTRNRYDGNLNLKNMAEETTSTDGDSLNLSSLPETTMVNIVVAEVSGTSPTLDVTIQGSDDDQNWDDLVSFPQASSEGFLNLAMGPADYKYYRYSSVIAGTETPTFSYAVYLSC